MYYVILHGLLREDISHCHHQCVGLFAADEKKYVFPLEQKNRGEIVPCRLCRSVSYWVGDQASELFDMQCVEM